MFIIIKYLSRSGRSGSLIRLSADSVEKDSVQPCAKNGSSSVIKA